MSSIIWENTGLIEYFILNDPINSLKMTPMINYARIDFEHRLSDPETCAHIAIGILERASPGLMHNS